MRKFTLLTILSAVCLTLTSCGGGSHEADSAGTSRTTLPTETTILPDITEITVTETTAAASTAKTSRSGKTTRTGADSGASTAASSAATTVSTARSIQTQGGGVTVPTASTRQSTQRTSASTHSTASTLSADPETTTAPITQKTTTQTVTQPPVIPHTIEERLAAMTLQEKAAQMMMGSAVSEADALAAAQNNVGAICLFAGAFSGKTAEEVREMTATLQAAAKTPLLLSVDEEGGTVNRVSLNWRLRGTPFRSPYAIFNEGGMDAVVSDVQEKASLLLSLGINVNLGPVCDVPLSSSNYIYSRSFGMDAALTSEYISAVIPEMSATHLGSVLKHFPGYGGSIDTHKYMAYDERSYDEFASRDLLPFAAGIAAGADAVMVSHNIVTCMDANAPASLSPEVHRVLREELGFTGVIMTDDLGMGAILQYSGGQDPAVAAVLAGNDIVTYANYGTSVPAIVSAVESGIISETQIDESVLRILAWKESLGLL